MKKITRMIMSSVLCLTAALGASGCGSVVIPGDEQTETVDTEKTQLYVYNYNGGYRTEWLYKAKARYEELHKDDTNWESGKKGVQIMVTPAKSATDVETIKKSKSEIYFIESKDYHSYVNKGAFADISDVLFTDNPYEPDKKIIDKLSEAQKAYFLRDGKYYALPGYEGYFGIAYDMELFEDKGFYLKKDADVTVNQDSLSSCFTRRIEERSYGPDGKTGIIDGVDYSADDGLPVTYDEFFALCKIMIDRGVCPLIWSGTYAAKHLTGLLHSLVAQSEGSEQMELTYSLDGEATTLGKIVDGKFVKDATSTTITTENGYELSRKKGNYDALTFIYNLINGTVDGRHYYYEYSFKTGFSHTNAQAAFLKNGITNSEERIGMLVDGAWWESEATDVFNDMCETNGEEYSKTNRKYGWMPLPKAEKGDGEITLVEDMYASVFVKSTIEEWKMPLAIDFLQFVHTDESLSEFTTTTNTPKALNYTMTDSDLAKLSEYGRSLLALKNRANVVYPLATNSVFLNNQTLFKDFPENGLYQSRVGSDRSNPVSVFKDYGDTISAADYFSGLYTFRKNLTIWEKS